MCISGVLPAQGSDSSSCLAISIKILSFPMPAKKCIPKGSLPGPTAHGIDIAGRPVIFDKGVLVSITTPQTIHLSFWVKVTELSNFGVPV